MLKYQTPTPEQLKFSINLVMILFFPGVMIAVLFAYLFGGLYAHPLSYNFLENFISDLGMYEHTLFPFFFDGIVISTGIICIYVFYYSNEIIKNIIINTETTNTSSSMILLKLSKYSLIFGPIGLIGIGIFSVDRDIYLLHFIFAIIAFLGYTIGSIGYGGIFLKIKGFFPKPITFSMIIAPVTTISLYGINLLFNPTIIPKPLAEWLVLLSIFWWVIPTGFKMLKILKKT